MAISDLPTMQEIADWRKTQSLQKGKSRLEVKVDAKPLTVITEKDFKKDVWTFAKSRCQKCGRKVLKTMERIPERGEVHHIHGREGALRFEARCAMLVCCTCHEQLTGRVSEKWVVVGTKFFDVQMKRHVLVCIDARQPIKFERVA